MIRFSGQEGHLRNLGVDSIIDTSPHAISLLFRPSVLKWQMLSVCYNLNITEAHVYKWIYACHCILHHYVALAVKAILAIMYSLPSLIFQ